MSGHQEVTYTLDFGAVRQSRRENQTFSDRGTPDHEGADRCIPRIARLLALAIRLEGLLRDETIRDYAELARLGRVTRARMTQIMKLLDLAPDIQEQILFLPLTGIVERIGYDGVVRQISIRFHPPAITAAGQEARA